MNKFVVKLHYWFGRYSLNAYIAPALLTTVPFFLFYYLYASSVLASAFPFFLSFRHLVDILFPVVLLTFLSILGNRVFRLFFRFFYPRGIEDIPIVNILLYSDKRVSVQKKEEIRGYIRRYLGKIPPSKKEEMKDESSARKFFMEAVTSMEKMCYLEEYVIKNNIRYSFAESLIGGAIIATLGSFVFSGWLFLIVNVQLGVVLALFGFGYLLILFFAKTLIKESISHMGWAIVETFRTKCWDMDFEAEQAKEEKRGSRN